MSGFTQSGANNIKLSERIKSFFYKWISYLAVSLALLSAIYFIYNFAPEFIRFCMDYVIKVMKSDYPNLS